MFGCKILHKWKKCKYFCCIYAFFPEKFSEMSKFSFFFEKYSRHLDLDFVLVAIWKQFSLLLRWRNLPPFTPKVLLGCLLPMQNQKIAKTKKQTLYKTVSISTDTDTQRHFASLHEYCAKWALGGWASGGLVFWFQRCML